jgi:hypothetical protein
VVVPDHPAFRYRLPERWLEPTQPSVLAPATPGPVRLPIAALDTLTQRLLGLQRTERAYATAAVVRSCPSSDLDSVTATSAAALDGAAGFPAAPECSRSDP